jgi:hypothetical protein
MPMPIKLLLTVLQMSAGLKILHQINSLAGIEEVSTPRHDLSTSDALLFYLKRYRYSKILNEYFKGQLQRHSDASGCDIVVGSRDPGMLNTEGSIATYPCLFKVVANAMGTAPVTGATSTLFEASAEEGSSR